MHLMNKGPESDITVKETTRYAAKRAWFVAL
jgi:hypothetical protein